MGGNKVRQMEFHLGDALAKGADTVISTSAVQSNHLRVLAAAASKLGLACEIQREDRVANYSEEYMRSGNVLLQDLFGATIHEFPEGENEEAADAALQQIAARVKKEGGKPYIIGLGPKNPPLGALGYVDATREMLDQFTEQGIQVDSIVLPSGSASTHAGTVVGLRALGSDIQVFGICIRRNRTEQAKRVWQRLQETAELINKPGIVSKDDVWVNDEYLGPSYGVPTKEMLAAVKLAARTEGLLLDPVYSGKGMAGLIGLINRGIFTSDSTVVYIHTGGTPALFAYGHVFQSESLVQMQRSVM